MNICVFLLLVIKRRQNTKHVQTLLDSHICTHTYTNIHVVTKRQCSTIIHIHRNGSCLKPFTNLFHLYIQIFKPVFFFITNFTHSKFLRYREISLKINIHIFYSVKLFKNKSVKKYFISNSTLKNK